MRRLAWAVVPPLLTGALGGCSVGVDAPEPVVEAAPRPERQTVASVTARPSGFVDWMATVPDAAMALPAAGGLRPGAPSEEATLRTADLDGDGRQEVVLSVGSSFRPRQAASPVVFRLTPGGDALRVDAVLTEALGRHVHIAGIVDLDGDGRWDIVQPTPSPMVTFDALAGPPWETWSMPTSIKQGEPFFEGTFGLVASRGVPGLDLLWPEPTCTAGLSWLRASAPRAWTHDPSAFEAPQPAVRLDGVWVWSGHLQGVGMACDGAPPLAYAQRGASWTATDDGLGDARPLSTQGPVAMAIGIDAAGAWDTWFVVGEHRVRVLERQGAGWRDTLQDPLGASPTRAGCNAMFQGGVPIDLDGDGRLDLVAAQGDDHTSGCAVRGIALGMSAWRRAAAGGWEDVTTELGLDGPVNAVSLYADDIDGDGDADLVVSGMGHVPALYRNDSQVPALGLRVVDGDGLRPAAGAWVVAEVAGLAPQARAVGGGTVRNATVSPWVGISAPTGRVAKLVVHFPDGRTVAMRDVDAGQTLIVRGPPTRR
ncbi:MAG: hypothetical protein RLZZ383_2981 [Pseudomonadota bacterium]|jgi:hypothetical protein